jgi:hypothetical protein
MGLIKESGFESGIGVWGNEIASSGKGTSSQ